MQAHDFFPCREEEKRKASTAVIVVRNLTTIVSSLYIKFFKYTINYQKAYKKVSYNNSTQNLYEL